MPLINWEKVSVSEQATIREAMQVLDQSAMQIVIIHREGKLLGTLTDGDIRRALLSGKTLESSASEAMNQKPACGVSYETELVWKTKMQTKGLRHLPIIDGNKNLTGLFYLKRGIVKSHPNPIVMMLGGLGMRMRPLTETVPKPMLRVSDKPILEIILNHIVEQGFVEFYFCINYLGDQIRAHFGDGERWGIKIHYIEETTRLGTAGALALLPALKHDFIVMNGDLLTKVDFVALLNFHAEHENSITACVREYSQQVPYGVVEFNDSKVSQIVEKPINRYFVNAGIYALSPRSLDQVTIDGYYDMPAMMTDLLDKNHSVGGFPLTEYWMDIGQMPDYEQAQVDYDVHFAASGVTRS
ncbi:nucleotidyltransferase family protein [Thiomicrospira sp. R3]|uniref:nucleotidyltransferase family protein n=1 Tax=Thiomicrospira sp. R3 TaxID=3035472 RepID=UPI00259B9759|nr:nucleotidyltransferase family protein [Thiomicrospira sp. R3]WFE67933.1 nucleotidyltransferase family protein [Thiomicrospira sp. R3]